MSSKSTFTIIGVIAIIVVSGVLVLTRGGSDTNTSTTNQESTTRTTSPATSTANNAAASSKIVTKQELTEADGKNGNDCYVALNGTVYEIDNNPQWRNGQHTPSEGQAYCGADMTDVIGNSPHGSSVIQQLTVVGALES